MSSYTFEMDYQAYGPDDLNELDGVLRQQFLKAAKSETGEEYATPGDYATGAAAEFDDDPEMYGADLYIIKGGAEEWLMWHFTNTDDGVLFKSDSTDGVPVILVQGEFHPHDQRWNGPKMSGEELARCEALAGQLEQAFNDREP